MSATQGLGLTGLTVGEHERCCSQIHANDDRPRSETPTGPSTVQCSHLSLPCTLEIWLALEDYHLPLQCHVSKQPSDQTVGCFPSLAAINVRCGVRTKSLQEMQIPRIRRHCDSTAGKRSSGDRKGKERKTRQAQGETKGMRSFPVPSVQWRTESLGWTPSRY